MEQAWGALPAPMVLMIMRDGAMLSFMLSDGGSVGIHARCPAPEPWPEPWHGPHGQGNAQVRQQAGAQLWSQGLPAPIRHALLASPPRVLTLQLDAASSALPWELAFDGSQHLDEKFPLARQLLNPGAVLTPPARAPTRQPLRVRVSAELGTGPMGIRRAQALVQALQRVPGIEATLDLEPRADGPASAVPLGLHDIVHCLAAGPPEAMVDALAGQRPEQPGTEGLILPVCAGPQLLVWEPAPETAPRGQDKLQDRGPRRARRPEPAPEPSERPSASELHAARCVAAIGMHLLVHQDETPDSAASCFMPVFYTHLARGLELGEAARRARIAAREHGEPCRVARLHGDARHALLRAGGAVPQADHLRQLTMLSCDMVDSTRLMRNLGSEAYSEILVRYHGTCAAVVGQHGGVADDPQGDDGIMCYFGFPQAAENATLMALRAGLDLLARMAEAGIAVRLGVATGQVVVRSGLPVGAAVHQAARLQAIAAPGTLVASEQTRRVAGERFDFERIEAVTRLKGFDQPEGVYRVLGESTVHGTERFDARAQLSPFVGRDAELARLRECWRNACAGDSLAVYISGEAGIGKSRLVREFRHGEAGRGPFAIEWRCAPEHASSALHPVTDFLRRYLRIQDTDPAHETLAKLGATTLSSLPVEHAVELVAQLLSVQAAPGRPALAGPPEKLRQQTLDLLLDWIRHIAAAAPLCLIVEDIHWIDPSTRELLGRLASEPKAGGLMLLMTGRPDAEQRSGAPVAIQELVLSGLSSELSHAMVAGVCEGLGVGREFMQWLVDRADGVPLFIEESARMALDLGAEAGDAPARRAPLHESVPATIHDLLMARLDRLPLAKHVAQVASAIGREFSPALIEAVCAHDQCPIHIAHLEHGLALLVRSGLLLPKGGAPARSYLFKHALVRDAAYGSMWGRDRKRLHAAIASVIQLTLPALAEQQPELLARHCSLAGMAAEAVRHWERAARASAARSAHHEAIAHLGQALEALGALAADADRDRCELRLQLLLAGRLIATEGYGADRVEAVYGRSLELCRRLNDEAATAKALFGLEGYHFMRADFGRAWAICDEAAALARRSADPMPALQSQWAAANLLFHQGELRTAVRRMDECLAGHHTLKHRPSAVQDPGVMCLCYSSWALWQLGQPDEALRRVTQVVDLARDLNHPFSMAEAYGFSTVVHHFRGEHEAAARSVQLALDICESGGFSVWLAHAQVMHGRLLAQAGEAERGVALMRSGYERWSATGAVVTRPFYLAMWAEGLALAGRPDEGLQRLADARRLIETRHERYYEPEVLRLSGELTRQAARQRGRNQDDEAQHWLDRALQSAEGMQQHGLALRAACSLAALWQSNGLFDAARCLIEAQLPRCTEGADTADLRHARTLLASIEAGAGCADVLSAAG